MKCSIAWSSLYVHADGKVTPCCGDLKFGDTRQSLVESFNGDFATKLRKQMRDNSSDLPEICSNCSLLQRLGSHNNFPELFPLLAKFEERQADDLATGYDNLSSAYANEELPAPGSKPLSLMVQFGGSATFSASCVHRTT